MNRHRLHIICLDKTWILKHIRFLYCLGGKSGNIHRPPWYDVFHFTTTIYFVLAFIFKINVLMNISTCTREVIIIHVVDTTNCFLFCFICQIHNKHVFINHHRFFIKRPFCVWFSPIEKQNRNSLSERFSPGQCSMVIEVLHCFRGHFKKSVFNLTSFLQSVLR